MTASDLVEQAGRIDRLATNLGLYASWVDDSRTYLFDGDDADTLREAASALRERIPLPGVEGREEGSSRELHQGSVVDAGSSATRERLIKHIRAALVEADFISTMGFEDRIKARTKLAEAVVTEIFGDGAERVHEGKLRGEPSILPLSSSRGEAEQK